MIQANFVFQKEQNSQLHLNMVYSIHVYPISVVGLWCVCVCGLCEADTKESKR